MRKYFIIIHLLIVTIYAFPQNGDWHKIDSLKKVSPALTDSGRIDCLNEISEAYHLFEIDTAKLYASQALQEAKSINYIRGMARAVKNFGYIEIVLGMDYLLMEKYFTTSLELFIKIQDAKQQDIKQIALTWRALGYAKWVLSKFPEAIEAYEKAIPVFKQMGDTNNLVKAYHLMSLTSLEWGHYEKALQYAFILQEITGKEADVLGSLYTAVGDYEAALEFYNKKIANGKNDGWMYLGKGRVFYQLKQYDSAFYYYQHFLSWANTSGINQSSKFYSSVGELQLALKHYDTALVYLNKALHMHKQASERTQVMHVLWTLSKTYKSINDYKNAMQTAQELLQLSVETGVRQYSRDAHFMLYELNEQLGIQNNAYRHLRQYTILKDSLDLNSTVQKLAFYKTKSEREKAQASIKLLNEEKKLQQQQLKQTAQQKNFLIAGLAALLVIGVVLFRNILLQRKNEKNLRELAVNELTIQKLESERKQADLQQQATELEMQALRTQMNPHFIFNCLSAINCFILTNEPETAADYLTRFSRLIRMVLNNSQKKFISLEEELENLNLYLYMENLRFTNKFQYSINCDDTIDVMSIYIPPLLLQPFVENAIWHGLMHKEGCGELLIDLHCENNNLHCTIRDNGIGRKKAAMFRSKSAEKNKSMGMQITRNRMTLLNQDLNGENYFEIHDIEDSLGNATGTLVFLKIKVKEMAEENASQNRW